MGFFMFGCMLASVLGLTAWAMFSDDDSEDSSGTVAVAPHRTLEEIAPSGAQGVATDFKRAAWQILKATAVQQARQALAGREGDIRVWKEGNYIVWEARSKRGQLIERGEIEDLGRAFG